MNIGLFGGSFNPVHYGHLTIAEELLKIGKIDQIWFVPCGNHVFGKNLIGALDRVKMLQLAIENNPKLKVITCEVESKEKSFTAKTIRYLKEKHPKEKFYFILGTDNLKYIQRWYDYNYLLREVEFILIDRPRYQVPKVQFKVKFRLRIKNNLSSTKIRENLKKELSIHNLVPKTVERYIYNKGLYNGKY